MRKLFAVLAVATMACGGGDSGSNTDQQAPAAAPAQPAAQPAPTGTVHEVQMLLTADGKYVYQPVALTIKQGDTVRWINVSGGPHNVAFYADKIPAGAANVLKTAMTGAKMGDLDGPLMVQPNAAYTMSFAGAPAGTYEYFCTPHEMLGMIATLTITQ